MKNKYKTIGILGGMGPVASANMYNKIISQAQKQLGAVQDIDYPLIILYSIGLEGFDETGIKDYAKVEKQLVAGVKHLEKCGAEIIVLACNTVYYFYDQLQAACLVPIVNMVDETAKRVASLPYKKIGLVSSETTSKKNIYIQALKKYSNKQIIKLPSKEQKLINEIVISVMSSVNLNKIKIDVIKILEKLKSLGAEAVLIGCTELSVGFSGQSLILPLVDAVEVVSAIAVSRSTNNIS